MSIAQASTRTGAPPRAAPRVAIIGGGWAGLAAAVELCAAGAPVVLYEAARQLGGRARRVDIDGHTLDNGQHILIGAYRETLRLIRRVHHSGSATGATSGADNAGKAGNIGDTGEAGSERLLRRLPLSIEHPAAGFRLRPPAWLPLPAPLHLACGLFGARGCTLAEKTAAARFMRDLQVRDYRLDADASVEALLDHAGCTGALRRLLWDPLCLAALNTPPERASAQIFANVLRDSLGGDRCAADLLLPAIDLGRLFPDAAAAFIAARGGHIRRSRRIEHCERLEQPERNDRGHEPRQRWRIDGETYDHVILATAPQHAAPLLERHAATRSIAARLAAYDYEPIGTVYIAYPPTVRLPAPMLGLGGRSVSADARLGQWAFDRGQLCGEAGLIAFVLSARGRWDERDNAALTAALHHELEAALNRPLPPPRWHKTLRERRATFSCRPNLFRPAGETPLPGLTLAGDYVCADYPATLEGAVRSGVGAAGSILAAPLAPQSLPGTG